MAETRTVPCPTCGVPIWYAGVEPKPKCKSCGGKGILSSDPAPVKPSPKAKIEHKFRPEPCSDCGMLCWWKGNGRKPKCKSCGGTSPLASDPTPTELDPELPAVPLEEKSIGEILKEATFICVDLTQHAITDPLNYQLAKLASNASAAIADLLDYLKRTNEIVIDWEVMKTR